MSGCPNGSKASADLAFWPVAQAHGARLITGARVREITVNEGGLATGAVYIDRQGVEHHQGRRSGDRGGKRDRHPAPPSPLTIEAFS